MFGRLISMVYLKVIRFFVHSVLKRGDRKDKDYNEVNKLMNSLHKSLIENRQLNEDFTEGPVAVQNKSSKELVAAFVATRDKRNEKDFYIEVGREWVKNLGSRNLILSFICIIGFIIVWAAGFLLSEYISGFIGMLYILGSLLFPVFGIYFAFRGQRALKWVLAAVNIFNLMTAMQIIY
ncbi:hypothetical protein [Oceanobacillus kapialis]|uniref:Uncharacterized protein n=2 Tax=Bacillati TaxID=1783272 RepID=A0ABW5PYT3_9BACI